MTCFYHKEENTCTPKITYEDGDEAGDDLVKVM